MMRYQTAIVPFPTWNLYWPLMMRQLSGLRNRMSNQLDSTLADCLAWDKGEWIDYPDHGGMVKISIPLVGRQEFRQSALREGWE